MLKSLASFILCFHCNLVSHLFSIWFYWASNCKYRIDRIKTPAYGNHNSASQKGRRYKGSKQRSFICEEKTNNEKEHK